MAKPKTAAIIVAGGSSRRMGFNKLLAELAGKPVLQRSLETFDGCPDIDAIILVTSDDVADLAAGWQIDKLLPSVAGGTERHLSVHQGLRALPTDTELVAVHDGARPLISSDAITRCLDAALQHGAAACAHPVTDTLKRADSKGQVTGSLDREGVWAMETPQCFRTQLLVDAYEQVIAEQALVTDEVSAVEHAGHPIYLINTGSPNPKITFPGDIQTAGKLLGS